MGMRALPGGIVRLTLSDAQPGALALLALGLSDLSFAGGALPLPLASHGLPGITLRTSAELLLFAPTGTNGIATGYATLDLVIPLAATGVPVFGQWVWLDPSTPSHHGSTLGHSFRVR
jgi:hypothetical protein